MIEQVFLILKRKWVICALAFLIALSLAYVSEKEASAAKTYNLAVKIVGAKTLIKGVETEITGGSLGTPLNKTTNKRGMVLFRKLAKGTYTVTPTKEGYTFDPESQDITFETKRREIATFTLTEVVNPPVTEEALSVSKPSNGTHFAAGEKPVITISLPDLSSRSDYSQLRLVVYGPQETTKTVTAVKLLNASTDRSESVHHYIDLITDTNVQLNDNILTYTLQPVSDEEAGTYTASLLAVLKSDSSHQSMPLADFQIGTATAETQIVEREKCGACHLGANNGQYYLHHVDPNSPHPFDSPEPYGYPSIDSWAVRTCKSCHNNDGYAAYTDPTDSTTKVPDPIVKRVHGVHRGEELKNPVNIDPDTGLFEEYIHVVFPADIKNCTKCHVDDRWNTTPSRLACGACHDNIWFGDPALLPTGGELHEGGPQLDDSGCSSCHPATGTITGVIKPITEVHKIAPLTLEHTVELSMSAPANGTHYVAGETPQIIITIKDATTGAAIDPTTITEAAWNRFRLQVSGPRENTRPVLTTAAKSTAVSTYTYNDLRVRTDPTKEDPGVTRSTTAITYQLDNVTGLESGTYTVFIQVRKGSTGNTAVEFTNFQIGTGTEGKKVATNCTDCHGDTKMHGSYPFNPDICKNCHDYKRTGTGYGWAGTPPTGTNGTSTSGWSGFGAKPLASRIHGVRRGRYLEHPEEVKPLYRLVSGVPTYEPEYDFSEVIFPQDIRNCTKCHSADTTGTWKTEPSRLACFACHDSDEANTHGNLMTYDPTPTDPWSSDEVETCKVCHGAGKDFAVEKMHNISNPYKPPHLRKPAE